MKLLKLFKKIAQNHVVNHEKTMKKVCKDPSGGPELKRFIGNNRAVKRVKTRI